MKLHGEDEISSIKKGERKWKKVTAEQEKKKKVRINADLSYKNVLKCPQGEIQDFIQKKKVLSGVTVFKYWKAP